MLSNRSPSVVILPSDVWSDWVDSLGHSIRYGYEGSTPLLHLPFIVLPMYIDGNHWIVSIFAYSNHSTKANKHAINADLPASIFILDSLHGKHPDLELKLKALLGHLINTSEDPRHRIRVKDLKKIPVYYPTVCSTHYMFTRLTNTSH